MTKRVCSPSVVFDFFVLHEMSLVLGCHLVKSSDCLGLVELLLGISGNRLPGCHWLLHD